MLHEPAATVGKDPAFAFKRRLGVFMFLIYGTIYLFFIALNVAIPSLVGKIVFFGLNLAVSYGFGLIVLALILALIYNWICGRRESYHEKKGEA
jgi:uncharacterized membrane protein (DUF485 family)